MVRMVTGFGAGNGTRGSVMVTMSSAAVSFWGEGMQATPVTSVSVWIGKIWVV